MRLLKISRIKLLALVAGLAVLAFASHYAFVWRPGQNYGFDGNIEPAHRLRSLDLDEQINLLSKTTDLRTAELQDLEFALSKMSQHYCGTEADAITKRLYHARDIENEIHKLLKESRGSNDSPIE